MVIIRRRSATVATVRAYALVILIASTARMPAHAQNAQPKASPPTAYYLALGDSITYGYQAFKAQANLPPSAYNTGYVDAFAMRWGQTKPKITVVNYGCPGESTESFLNGPCIWTETGHQLHDTFSGSQMQAAVGFLRAHPGPLKEKAALIAFLRTL